MSKTRDRIDVLISDALQLSSGGSTNKEIDDETKDHIESYLEDLETIRKKPDNRSKPEIIKAFRDIVRVRERVRIEGMISVDRTVKERLEYLAGEEIPEQVLTRRKLFEEVVDKATADIAEILEEDVLSTVIRENRELADELDRLRSKTLDSEPLESSASASDLIVRTKSSLRRLAVLIQHKPLLVLYLSTGTIATISTVLSYFPRLTEIFRKSFSLSSSNLSIAALADENHTDPTSTPARIVDTGRSLLEFGRDDAIVIIIVCLVICYMLSLLGLFVLKSKPKIDFCLDSLKGLTGFFIGVATGFFDKPSS